MNSALTSTEDVGRLFDEAAISSETSAVNARLMATLAAYQPPIELEAMRAAYASGAMGLPVPPKAEGAREMRIPGPVGDIPLRVLIPENPRGAYLHIHGGGWMLGTNDMQDSLLEHIGRAAGLITVSVDYRLAPEHPFPAPVDDCVAAAEWLIDNSVSALGVSWLAIGGESAGAHLVASTLIRLRDAGRVDAFRAANLTFGCFDLSLTPSVRHSKGTAFVDRPTLEQMATGYAGTQDLQNPAISPLYADLTGLPAALFIVGTIDPLVDDTLFMHILWQKAGNSSQLAVFPGGVHGFHLFDSDIAIEANQTIGRFLHDLVGDRSDVPTS